MFHINDFNEKIILNEELLRQLRNVNLDHSGAEVSRTEFLSLLDDYLSNHLRGMEFDVKKQIKQVLYADYLGQAEVVTISYYTVLKVLIELELPSKQLVSNFQNWVLMSTEFTVDLEDVLTLYKEVTTKEKIEIPLHVAYFEEEVAKENASTTALPPVEETECINTQLEPAVAVLENTAVEEKSNPPVKKYKIRHKVLVAYLVGLSLFFTGLYETYQWANHKEEVSFRDACMLMRQVEQRPTALTQAVKFIYENGKAGYPEMLAFQSVNKERLQGFLKRNNSLLSDDPYFSKIYELSAKYDVHPALLFAITGQEQGFVKRGSENSALIINNPYNVYHSWAEYNTNISDSTEVACITIRNILAERPSGTNAFKWLNKTYAEDPNWWQGTEQIFFTIETYVGTEPVL